MAIKKGDFIELSYTGRILESGKVFDTNDESAAKKEGVFNAKSKYEPIVVCVGEEDVVKGLDESFEGKDAGKPYSIEVPAEKAFGKKDAKMYKLVPASLFKDELRPMPGLQVTFNNGQSGVIKTVSGGRILVDFNHPLAGHALKYDVKIVKPVVDDAEKLKGFIKFYLGMDDAAVDVKDGKAKITMKTAMPAEIQNLVKEKAMKRILSIKEVEFAGHEKAVPKKEEAVEKKPESEKKEEIQKAPAKKQ